MPTRPALTACRLRELEPGSARTRRPVVGDGTRSRLFRLPGSFRSRKSFPLEPRDVIWAERGRKLKPPLRSPVPGRDVAGRAGSSWARAGAAPPRAAGAQPPAASRPLGLLGLCSSRDVRGGSPCRGVRGRGRFRRALPAGREGSPAGHRCTNGGLAVRHRGHASGYLSQAAPLETASKVPFSLQRGVPRLPFGSTGPVALTATLKQVRVISLRRPSPPKTHSLCFLGTLHFGG